MCQKESQRTSRQPLKALHREFIPSPVIWKPQTHIPKKLVVGLLRGEVNP